MSTARRKGRRSACAELRNHQENSTSLRNRKYTLSCVSKGERDDIVTVKNFILIFVFFFVPVLTILHPSPAKSCSFCA